MKGVHSINRRVVLNHRWQFDPRLGLLIDLHGRTNPIQLAPDIVHILATLSRAPFIAITKQQLLASGSRSRESLQEAIDTLCRTFEALPPGRTYIRTIPRIGYYLLADVSTPMLAGITAEQVAWKTGDERTAAIAAHAA